MEAPDEGLEQRIAAVERDSEHGAGFLTREAVTILGSAASSLPDDSGWADRIEYVADRLARSKPAMAGLRNAVTMLKRDLLLFGPSEGRAGAGASTDGLLAWLEGAGQQAGYEASIQVPAKAAVLTCSYSAAVLRALEVAHDQHKSPTAIVLEPSAVSTAHGVRMVREINELGVPSEIVDETRLAGALASASLVLIGADAVSAAHVVNGVPSMVLAEAVRGQVPCYAVCESVKITDEAVSAPGYDLVPLEYFSGVITENGVLSQQGIESQVSSM